MVTGVADVYVRRGAPPTPDTYDATTVGQTGDTKVLPLDTSAPGLVHVLARSVPGGNGALTVRLVRFPALRKARPAFLTTAAGGSKLLAFTPSAAGKTVSFTLSGGEGEADLYVKSGAAPTTASFDASSATPGTNEAVTVTAGTAPIFVLVTAPSAHALVSLLATES